MIDKLIKLVRQGFSEITDSRRNNSSYNLSDLLSVGFAIFSLKDSSLASFKEQYSVRAENLERIYGIKQLPGETALREGLDDVDPKDLQEQFKAPINVLRQQGVLKFLENI